MRGQPSAPSHAAWMPPVPSRLGLYGRRPKGQALLRHRLAGWEGCPEAGALARAAGFSPRGGWHGSRYSGTRGASCRWVRADPKGQQA